MLPPFVCQNQAHTTEYIVEGIQKTVANPNGFIPTRTRGLFPPVFFTMKKSAYSSGRLQTTYEINRIADTEVELSIDLGKWTRLGGKLNLHSNIFEAYETDLFEPEHRINFQCYLQGRPFLFN